MFNPFKITKRRVAIAGTVAVVAIIIGSVSGSGDSGKHENGSAAPKHVTHSAAAPKHVAPKPKRVEAPKPDIRYQAYAVTVEGYGDPVASKSQVDGWASAFCDSSLTPEAIRSEVVATITRNPDIDPGQFGHELGAVIGAYCSDRVDVFTEALAQ